MEARGSVVTDLLVRVELSSTLEEYRLYAAPAPRLATEQFIELWDCDLLTLPEELPPWLELEQAVLQEERALWRAQRPEAAAEASALESATLFRGSPKPYATLTGTPVCVES